MPTSSSCSTATTTTNRRNRTPAWRRSSSPSSAMVRPARSCSGSSASTCVLRTTRAAPSPCSDPCARRVPRRRALAAAACCIALMVAPALRAQVDPHPQEQEPRPALPPQDPPQPPVPPGARVDIGDVVLEKVVKELQGKPVRAIQVQRPDAESNTLRVLDQASTESFVRSLQTRVGQPFEARKVSDDCNSLWRDLRTIVQAWVQEVDGEVVVTFLVEREVKTYASVEFVGLNHLERFDVDSLLGLTADRQVTETEAEAMRKVLI